VSDRLERAFRSLREHADGRSPQAEETLARVLDDLRRAPVRRAPPVSARVWLLAAAILAISTAAAARSGEIGRVLHALVGGASESAPPATAAPPHAAPPRIGVTPPLASAGEIPPTASAGEIPPTASPGETPAPVPTVIEPETAPSRIRTALRPSTTTSARTQAPAPDPSPAPPMNPVPAPDDQAFANAHALHFHGSDPARALAAWDDYLRDFPEGRFAPEARYNRSIDLLKLGRTGEAKDALRPFANGAYGPYRQEEARAILRSIDPGP
jgi:hypothetical protein